MNIDHYQINNRFYTTFSKPSEELKLDPLRNYLFPLSYKAVLTLNGDKNREFLQGQLSCNVEEVTEHTIRQGALCNLKGRVMALTDVVDWNGLHLVLPKDLVHHVKNTLSKTAVFSKITLDDSESDQLFGFYLQNPDDLMPFNLRLPTQRYECVQNNDYCCYHLGNHLYIILVKKTYCSFLTQPFDNRKQLRGALAWHAITLKHNYLEIYPESRGLFLPHRMNLHEMDYLSFNKGCYKGQEIIARTHFRAKLKHTLKLFVIETDAELQSGQKIFDLDGTKEVGEVIDFTPLDSQSYLIAASILIDHPQKVQLEGSTNSITL